MRQSCGEDMPPGCVLLVHQHAFLWELVIASESLRRLGVTTLARLIIPVSNFPGQGWPRSPLPSGRGSRPELGFQPQAGKTAMRTRESHIPQALNCLLLSHYES